MSLNKRLFIPQDTEIDPTEHFNTVSYSGNGGTKEVTSVGFQPDLVWIKARNAVAGHQLYNSVRGVHKALQSNGTSSEQDYTSADKGVDSFLSNGFTVKDTSAGLYGVNGASGGTYSGTPPNYVAWCLKGGGAASGSDKVSIDGTSYSDEAAAGLTAGSAAVNKLSVNTKLGFSIATGSVAANGYTNTYCHGLDVKPDMIITKVTSGSSDWITILPNMSNNLLKLNDTDNTSTDSFFQGTSTTLKTGYTTGAYDFVAYCFASKEGVSKVGSFGYSAGTSVNVGFQPRFVLFKKSSGSGSWYMADNQRVSGSTNYGLFANKTNVEDTATNYLNLTSTGFTTTFSDSGTYIYLAIA